MSNQTRTLAQATTTVHIYDLKKYDAPSSGPALARVHIEESFNGDIEALGVGEVLQVMNANKSATLVGIERMNGTIAGKKGTFVLQVTGTIQGETVTCEWFVVPDSGTDALTGLRGDGGFKANLSKGAEDVHLNYWFE